MSLDQALAVVAVLEVVERALQFLDGREALQPLQLFLEAVGAAVTLGLAHVRRARLDAQEAHLVLVSVRDELAAVVVPLRDARKRPTNPILSPGVGR